MVRTSVLSLSGDKHPMTQLSNGVRGYGALGTRAETGHCSACGGASFDYNNGAEWSRCGTRGYRCCYCATIKPERVKVSAAFSKPIRDV